MAKKYGGVDNKQTLESVQEAFIVGAPKKPTPRRSIGSIIAGWIAFIIITYILIEFILMATGLFENQNIPAWVLLTIPLLPTLIRAVLVIIKILQHRSDIAG